MTFARLLMQDRYVSESLDHRSRVPIKAEAEACFEFAVESALATTNETHFNIYGPYSLQDNEKRILTKAISLSRICIEPSLCSYVSDSSRQWATAAHSLRRASASPVSVTLLWKVACVTKRLRRQRIIPIALISAQKLSTINAERLKSNNSETTRKDAPTAFRTEYERSRDEIRSIWSRKYPPRMQIVPTMPSH